MYSFQKRVFAWCRELIGDEKAYDRRFRSMRVLEEAIELAQSEGLEKEVALKWVEHVYSKPKGEPDQEAGGLGVCLLAWASAAGTDLEHLFYREFKRINSPEMIAKIREKQKEKNKVSE